MKGHRTLVGVSLPSCLLDFPLKRIIPEWIRWFTIIQEKGSNETNHWSDEPTKHHSNFHCLYTSNKKWIDNPKKQIIWIKMKLIQESDLFISLIPSFDIVMKWFTKEKIKILFLGMILHKRYAERHVIFRFNSIGLR